MNQSLKFLSDEELWVSTIREAGLERNSTLKVIAYLQEINVRRLHLKRGYPSLHEYCVNVLKYSDGSAYRRIKAMNLVEDLPETKKSIEMGTLNLTTASQLQKVIETKKKTSQPLGQKEKLNLFHELDGKSKREIEKSIAAVCPEVILRSETQRHIDQDKIKKTLIITEDLNEKIEKLKKLKSHENKDFVQILKDLVDKELKRIDPGVPKPAKKEASPEKLGLHSQTVKLDLKNQEIAALETTLKDTKPQTHAIYSRYIPAHIKREVWKQSNNQCAYIDPLTKKKCNSTHWLQIDHILPFAKGGPTVPENLRLLCANHNKLEAINHFGERKLTHPH